MVARKLKTYQTSLGFFEQAIAASRERGRWKWSARTTDRHVIMCGSERSRSGAR
jgi:hypothetical protein